MSLRSFNLLFEFYKVILMCVVWDCNGIRECPRELREAIASIIFAAPRCSEVPDLLQLKNLFGTKYGKEFIMVSSELRPDSGVNRTVNYTSFFLIHV